MNAVSKANPLKYYKWGEHCEGWNLVENHNLSVKLETMPAGAEEILHYHQQSQQFFFILKGKAAFEIDSKVVFVQEGQGIHIQPGQKHRIVNRSDETLEFILCSQPSTINDRINIA
ncbi:MAG: cupin domain-containing protein [Bacteroidetes bacterium]|nr:MAG: cupin domain-containing protein [Bacteroidota bacterium]